MQISLFVNLSEINLLIDDCTVINKTYYYYIEQDIEKIGPNYEPLKSCLAVQPAIKANIPPEGSGMLRNYEKQIDIPPEDKFVWCAIVPLKTNMSDMLLLH